MSSYMEFPGHISNPYDVLHNKNDKAWTDYNYFDLTEGWCHCFRHPDKYIPNNFPKSLISESDFADFNRHVPNNKIEKVYDFIYICLKDNEKCQNGWQSYNRNWELTEKCLNIMCNKFKLKGLLIGRVNCKLPNSCHNLMELTDFVEYKKFIKYFNQVKFIFVPNRSDASPRVLTEAMCYDIPALINYNILGGWKYINKDTGIFFNDINNFEFRLSQLLEKIGNGKLNVRNNFINNFGTINSGKKLLKFITKCIPRTKLNLDLDKVEYLKPGI